jgi:hypothetical protein
VVLAQELTGPGEGVLAELAGLFIPPSYPQIAGEAVGQVQGGGVVVAKELTGPGEGVFDELTGLLVMPEHWAASRFPDSWLVAILRCGLPI